MALVNIWFVIFCSVSMLLSSCIPSDKVPTHQTLLVWTDSDTHLADTYSLSADESVIGYINSWVGKHGCDSIGYLHYEIPIGVDINLSLDGPNFIDKDLATIHLYQGGSGASIKRHNNTIVNLDGTSYSGCILLYINWTP